MKNDVWCVFIGAALALLTAAALLNCSISCHNKTNSGENDLINIRKGEEQCLQRN